VIFNPGKINDLWKVKMIKAKTDEELKINISTSPEVSDFCQLLAKMIWGLTPKQRKKIIDQIFFITMRRKDCMGEWAQIPPGPHVVIIFVLPYRTPQEAMWVIAHELGHFLCNHHIRSQYIEPELTQKGLNMKFEVEAEKKAKEILQRIISDKNRDWVSHYIGTSLFEKLKNHPR